MAPKEPFKVHSLNKHIEATKKGLSAESQYNKRPASKPAAPIKKEPGAIDKGIFGNNSDDDDSDSSSSGSSDEDGSDFLRKLAPQTVKSSATVAASKKQTRKDEIADSDDERKPATKNRVPVKPKQSEKPQESSSDDSSSESDSESAKGEQKVRANGVPRKAATSSSSSSDSSSESEEDDDKAPKKANAKKVEDSSSSDEASSDDSGSESDDESEPEAATKAKAATKSKTPTKASNGTSTAATSDTSSSGEDSSDEKPTPVAKSTSNGKKPISDERVDDSSEESGEEEADESMHIENRQSGRQVAVPDFIAPDFVLRKSDGGSNGQDVARICNQANMQGKQVWYFTVPANVPISVVQNMEIPMNQSQRGDSIFSHNGEDYGISLDSMTPKSSIQILIPSPDGTRYQSGKDSVATPQTSIDCATDQYSFKASRSIDQVMQVKKITQLGEASASASSIGPAPKKAPRLQPEGLKARYQPFGVSSPMGQIGVDLSFRVEDDTEMADAPALTTPFSSGQDKAEKKDKKKKHKEKDSETPRKGKRKHASSEEDAIAAAEQLMEENLSAETKSKKQKTRRSISPDLGSDAPSSTTASKKKTLVVPPAIPASTPVSKSKSSKAKSETPGPKPRETAVPVPSFPGSSQPKVSPVPIPHIGITSTPSASKEEKKSKKKKAKSSEITTATQQSPPPSAQPAGKTSKGKVTPVPMPKLSG